MEAARGTIYDRNGQVLAGEGTVSTVGLIPGKMAEDASQDLQTLAGLLGLTVEDIQAELEQSWVQEDTFVPIRKISKSQDTEEAVNAEALRHRKIIFTPGSYFKGMLSDVSIQKFEIPKTDETGGSQGGGSEDRPEIE